MIQPVTDDFTLAALLKLYHFEVCMLGGRDLVYVLIDDDRVLLLGLDQFLLRLCKLLHGELFAELEFLERR